jgi:hypothetical protein
LEGARPELALRQLAKGLHKPALLIGKVQKHAILPLGYRRSRALATIIAPSSNLFPVIGAEALDYFSPMRRFSPFIDRSSRDNRKSSPITQSVKN